MANGAFALKGNIIYTPQPGSLVTGANSYLVCDDEGRVAGVFDRLPQEFAHVEVTDYGDKLIIPGLVDLHTHAPQYALRGLGMDMELLPWLETYVFPEEAKYDDISYAQEAYEYFVNELKNGAITRAAIFGTIHVPATIILMEMLEATGLKTVVGKVNMDRNSSQALSEQTEKSLEDTVEWLEQTANKFQNVQPILTPRFIPTCSDDLMRGLKKIQQKYGLGVQSHLSENGAEIAWVRELSPESSCYGDAYRVHGMFGGDVPTIMAHCVHPTPEELKLLKDNQVLVAHCPQSNANLGSGVAPVALYLRDGIPVGLGSDVAGGTELSMFRAMSEAVRASKIRQILQDNSLPAINVMDSFYMGTKGGGAFWGKVGSFEQGYEFDAIVVDDITIKTTGDYMSLPQRLERMIYLDGNHLVVGKYVAGKKII